MVPPVVANASCVFNKIGEGLRCPERETLLDDMPCFGILRLVTTYYTYPEPTPCRFSRWTPFSRCKGRARNGFDDAGVPAEGSETDAIQDAV